jgi:hypothetical protein
LIALHLLRPLDIDLAFSSSHSAAEVLL